MSVFRRSYAAPITINFFMLVSFGLITLYAASAMKALDLHGSELYFLKKQGVTLAFCTLLFFTIQWLPFKFFERIPLFLLLLSLSLLALVLLPGAYAHVGGASRWLLLGPLRIQTSELAKMSLIFFVAKNLSRPKMEKTSFSGFFGNLAILGAHIILLMLQPDFGTSVLLCMVVFSLLFLAGYPLRFLGWVLFPSTLLATLAIFSEPYRLKRLISFIDPWADFKNGGFQIIQSYLGFQSGGILGLGLGESKQKLFFLPEAHTDFIFSVIGEELGLAGTLTFCLLFANLSSLGLKVATHHQKPFQRLLATGITLCLSFQAAMNLGVVTGLLPTKGIPLPFVSNGLSSLIVSSLLVAILVRIGQEVPRLELSQKKPPPRE